MTAIVSWVQNGIITMGSDSADVGGEIIQSRKEPKVFIRENLIIGTCGSWRFHQSLRYAPYDIGQGLGVDKHEWFVRNLLPWMRRHVPAPDLEASEALVGIQGSVFHIYGGEQAAEVTTPYDACGSGAQVARGALYALDVAMTTSPRRRVEIALEAAEKFCTGVRGPFDILEAK